MNILIWIIFGGIAGWLATIITGDEPAFGILGNIVIGIAGALLGGWIADALFKGKPGAERPSNIWGFVTAVLGAILLLWIINLFV